MNNFIDSVKIRPRKACKYPNLRSFGWVSYDKVGVFYSEKFGSRPEARASDLRSYPGLCLVETNKKATSLRRQQSEYSPRTCSIGRPAGGHSVSPTFNLTCGVDGTFPHLKIAYSLGVKRKKKKNPRRYWVKEYLGEGVSSATHKIFSLFCRKGLPLWWKLCTPFRCCLQYWCCHIRYRYKSSALVFGWLRCQHIIT